MTTYVSYSHSPRIRAIDPVTPVHSPHHSVHSSTSSRAPLQPLTLHEYRKQQNAPTPRSATPPGKTLRRKAAASALNEIERVPSFSRTPLLASRKSSRPLHLSQSAYQSAAHQPFPPSPPLLSQPSALPDRALSAEPYNHSSTTFNIRSLETSQVKGTFKPIKRLPKPPPANQAVFPPPLSFVKSTRSRLSPLHTTSYASSQTQHSSDTQTPSTFSLSQFPQPPHGIDPSFSPPNDENQPLHGIASFTTTAPVTPPATPAVIHYRGTSFDLVNPHESLFFHDIVTPSRDIDSTEYLPLRTSEEALDSPEMAPKRPLYGDLSSAYTSIRGRGDDPPNKPNMNLPLPPTPVAFSPGSSQFSSPAYSPEAELSTSPLSIKKPETESQFSFKRLTRSLTRKLSRISEPPPEEELQEYSISRVSAAASYMEGNYPRPLDQTYRSTLEFPESGFSSSPFTQQRFFSENETQRFSTQRYESAPLSSLLPEDPSTEKGRAEDPRVSISEGDILSRPYYGASIYPSSSTNTGDDGQRDYGSSPRSRGVSNPFGRLSDDAGALAEEFNRNSIYAFDNSHNKSRESSRPVTQDYFRRSLAPPNDKADTLSKFIDQYGHANSTSGSHSILDEECTYDHLLREDAVSSIQVGHARKPTLTHNPGLPPSAPAPLAPAFEYDNDLRDSLKYDNALQAFSFSQQSEAISGNSSYGDTCQLLQLSQPGLRSGTNAPPMPANALEPSSSYSQPEAEQSHTTPQEALDEAEKIFTTVTSEEQTSDIPAMWASRNSGSFLRRRQANNDTTQMDQDVTCTVEEDKGDWETIADGPNSRRSLDDSIADYSSTEDSRLSLAFDDVLPQAWTTAPVDRDLSLYRHPSPLPAHPNPFGSSPPELSTRASICTAPGGFSSSLLASSPPMSSTMPAFGAKAAYAYGKAATNGLSNAIPPPWLLNEKETEELLASGPNDEILYEDQQPNLRRPVKPGPSFSTANIQHQSVGLERENTFEKFSVIGPKGNLTGTPRGTGMHDAGSSIADTSSPVTLGYGPFGRGERPELPNFYITPGDTGSVTRIRDSQLSMSAPLPEHGRTLSQRTLFLSHRNMDSRPDIYLPPLSTQKLPIRPSGPASRSRRQSRAAVPGQTKLRTMVLAPDAQTISSGHSTHISRFVSGGGSGRPSTSNTNTPLRAYVSQSSLGVQVFAYEHSPHLLCPEKVLDPKAEEERRKISWWIFALFCILPPTIILFRWMGDFCMVSLTKGRLGYCAEKPKRLAVPIGIAVNVILSMGIAIPILTAHAAGKL